MKFAGFLIVLVGVFGGYLLGGGHMAVILHSGPHEMLVIGGAAIGAFIVANPMHVIRATLKNMNCLVKPETHTKESYLELLSVMYMLFKLARTKGWLALE